MELILFRHALAEDRFEFQKKGLEDHLRPLTLKGRKRMQKVCNQIRDQIKELDLIVSSPYARARQTAEIISQVYSQTKIVEVPELAPHSAPILFLKWLRTQGRHHRKIAVVGHEPHLSSFASFMLSGAPQSFIDLKKSGIIGIQLESFEQAKEGYASLMFSVPPRFIID